MKTSVDTSLHGVLGALSRLLLLTQLEVIEPARLVREHGVHVPAPPANAFTALTVSTNLHTLNLEVVSDLMPAGHITLFKPGAQYQHMAQFGTRYIAWDVQLALQVCSSCSNLQSLQVVPEEAAASLAAWQPLLQLTALTQLEVHLYCSGAAAAGAAIVSVAAHLPGLQQLSIYGCPSTHRLCSAAPDSTDSFAAAVVGVQTCPRQALQ